MEKHWAYCSACDRQVEVIVKKGVGRHDPLTGEPAGALVCLEAGHTCTGALCPITDGTPEEMRGLLRRFREDDSATAEED